MSAAAPAAPTEVAAGPVPPSPAREPARVSWRALVSAALLTADLALLYALDQTGLERSILHSASESALRAAYVITAATGFACALVPARRRPIALAAALIVAPIVLGAWSLVLFGYAALVIALARAPVRLPIQMLVALVAWAALPVVRLEWLDGDAQADTILLAIVWAGQLYAAFYLMIERAREAPARRPGIVADAFYLLALPRLVVPFFQPISPRQLARAARRDPAPRLLWRAAGLAVYAAGAAVLASFLGRLVHTVRPEPLALAVWFVAMYLRATYTIFLAIAVFRLLGWHLPSGFRTPFLSSSFAEFFRRFNYYVRDAVLSLFYYPLLGRLRHAMRPRAATIVSAYLAIFVGSFLLHDVLVPLSVTAAPDDVIDRFLNPVRVLGFLALWTLIIVPTAGLAPRRPAPRTRLRTALAVAVFNILHAAVWYAQVIGHGSW